MLVINYFAATLGRAFAISGLLFATHGCRELPKLCGLSSEALFGAAYEDTLA